MLSNQPLANQTAQYLMLRKIKKTMKHIKYVSLMLIVFLLIIAGCSGDYGMLERQTSTDKKMTLAELRENWEDYHIYYSRSGGTTPINIMFDPKNDETRLVGDGWFKIADQKTLSETMERIETVWVNHGVMIIEGPDGRFFGYMYCSWTEWGAFSPGGYHAKLVDEHTLYVFQGL